MAPEETLRALLAETPDVLWGIADIGSGEFSPAYRAAIMLAVPYGEQLSLEDYAEERFEAGIAAARERIDGLVPRITALLSEAGFRSLVPPVAQRDEIGLLAPFSFKWGAVHAGLGWIGRNDVLITERYGPRVRLSAVLTDADLPCAVPVTESRCPPDCRLCADACPCKALKGATWNIGIRRDELIDYHRCNRFRSAAIPKLGRKNACGRCLAVCPFGASAKRDAAAPAQRIMNEEENP